MAITMTGEPTFKDRNPEFQQLVRELRFVREFNEEMGPGGNLLLFAEGLLVFVALERLLRMLLPQSTKGKWTLHTLLREAVQTGHVRLPSANQEEGIRRIVEVRDTLLHGCYEAAARGAKVADSRTYVEQVYSSEIRTLTGVLAHIVDQIDQTTGEPRNPSTKPDDAPARDEGGGQSGPDGS